jgi:hypothetical protein
MGGAHVALPQDQVQVGMHALRTSFTDAAEGRQVHRHIAIEVVDEELGIELGEQEAVVGRARVAAAVDRMDGFWAGWRFKG